MLHHVTSIVNFWRTPCNFQACLPLLFWTERGARVKACGFIIIWAAQFWNSLTVLSFNGEVQGVYDCGRWRGGRWFDRWLTSFVWSWQSEVWTSRVAIECFTTFGWETSNTQGALVARLEAYIWDLLHAYGIRFQQFHWWESKKEGKQKGQVPMFTRQCCSNAKSCKDADVGYKTGETVLKVEDHRALSARRLPEIWFVMMAGPCASSGSALCLTGAQWMW